MTSRAVDCGDSGVRVTSDATTPEARWRHVHAIAASVLGGDHSGIVGAVPTYDAVLIEFDCGITDHATVRSIVDGVDHVAGVTATRPPRLFDVPVVYGGAHGPDLGGVAALFGVTEAEVVRLHTARPLVMRCFGSPGGAPMMDGPAFPGPVARLTSPRPSVPAGAAAVAGRQAVISARPAPGGWQVLGTTPVVLVSATSEPLSPFAPGDRFRFRSIDGGDWDQLVGRPLDELDNRPEFS